MCWREKAKSALKRENIANMLQHLNVVKSMQHNLKYLKEERGAIFVLTALLLPIMFGCLGIAYDVGNIYIHKARLQNVTDAAALAGGRAYLESQKKTTGTIDNIDENDAGHNSDNPFTYTIAGRSNRSVDGITYDSTRKHADADKAADDYIYNNIINLGETVHADKYSHYALRGLKKNAVEAGQESADPTYNNTEATEIFYRIGLYETVPLYFLPVITDKNKEIVRAGSVVLVQPGKTTVIPDGEETTTTSYSIFDNLFTYSDEFHSVTGSDNTEARMAFIGDMVYTHGSNTHDNYYTYSDVGLVKHLYTSRGTFSENDNLKINDATIDTTFNTLDYLGALTTEKLKQPHVSLLDINRDPQTLYASDINNENSSIYLSYISGPNGETVWKGRTNNTPYIYQDNEYYAVDGSNGNYLTVNNQKVTYRKYGDQNLKQYLPSVKDGDKYYVLNNDNTKSDYYLNDNNGSPALSKGNAIYNLYRNGKYYNKDSNGTYFIYENGDYYQVNEWGDYIWANGGAKIPYTPLDTSFQSELANLKSSITEEFYQQEQDKYKAKVLSNIFYITHNMNIVIDEEVVGVDNPTQTGTPIYIIADGDDVTLKLNVNVSNKRPIVIVYTGHSIQLQVEKIATGATFEGIIYAPYSTGGVHLHNEEDATFKGNVIAHKIEIQNSGKSTWQQYNYLDNPDPNTYTDNDVAKVTEEIRKANENNSYDSLSQDIKDDILNTLGIDESKLGNMDWYNSLSYDDKQSFYRKWKTLYEKYKNNNAARNVLWPWNQHFMTNGTTVTSDESLRLINYRTEHRENHDVVDPFIFESLEKPNSY